MNKKQIILGALVFVLLIGFLNRDFLIQEYRKISGASFNSHVLTIVLNTATNDLSPYSLNLNDRTRAANLYEGLVAFDPNLKIIPVTDSIAAGKKKLDE